MSAISVCKNAQNTPLNAWIENRKDDLYAIEQIAPHQVGAAQIELLMLGRIAEIIDPAVFKVAAHKCS